MEYVDVCDENGLPTGEIVERSTAHRTGVRHRTAHVWIYRETEGRYQVLVQKRSDSKASFPGMYDTSCAGHVPAGEEPIDAAVRELSEELGIRLRPDQLEELGQFDSRDDLVFRGVPFRTMNAALYTPTAARSMPAAFTCRRTRWPPSNGRISMSSPGGRL